MKIEKLDCSLSSFAKVDLDHVKLIINEKNIRKFCIYSHIDHG